MKTQKIILTPIRNPKPTLIISGIITIASIWFAVQIKTDNSMETWFGANNQEISDYNDFKDNFGEDASLILIFKNPKLFSPTELALLRKLTDTLSALPETKSATSLVNLKIPRVTALNLFMRDLIPNNPAPIVHKEKIMGWKILKDNILSADGTATGIVLIPKNIELETLTNLIRKIREIIALPTYGQNTYYLVGDLAINQEMDSLSNKESSLFLLLAFIMFLVLLLINLKNFKLAFFTLLNAFLGVVWTLGLFALAGQPFNLVSSTMPLIIIVLGIAVSIHITTRFQKKAISAPNKKAALETALLDVAKPCLYSTLTTAAAFLAFSTSKIRPITIFGLFSSAGICLSYLASFAVLPVLLSFADLGKIKKKRGHIHKWDKFFESITNKIAKYPNAIIATSIFVFAVSVIGVLKLNFETDQINYLKKNNPVRQSNTLAQKWFEGTYPLEIVFRIEDGQNNSLSDYIGVFSKIENEIMGLEKTKTIHSPNVIVNDVIYNNKLKTTPRKLLQKIQHTELLGTGKNLTNSYFSNKNKKYRLSIKTVWMNDAEAMELMDRIGEIIDRNIDKNKMDYYFTGIATLYIKMNTLLTKSQLYSITTSFVILFLMMLLLFRKLLIALLGMLPNVLPVLGTIGIMGWLKVPMDVATVLIASISLGIAVDDTIHFLSAYRANKTAGNSAVEAIGLSFGQIGRPISLTTLLLVAGFAVMAFSSFMPLVFLGVFVSLNVLLALLYDLFLLPSVLIKINKFKLR